MSVFSEAVEGILSPRTSLATEAKDLLLQDEHSHKHFKYQHLSTQRWAVLNVLNVTKCDTATSVCLPLPDHICVATDQKYTHKYLLSQTLLLKKTSFTVQVTQALDQAAQREPCYQASHLISVYFKSLCSMYRICNVCWDYTGNFN